MVPILADATSDFTLLASFATTVLGLILLIMVSLIAGNTAKIAKQNREAAELLRDMAGQMRESTANIAFIEAHAKRVRDIYDASQPR